MKRWSVMASSNNKLITLQNKWLFEKYHTNVWDVVGIGRPLYYEITVLEKMNS